MFQCIEGEKGNFTLLVPVGTEDADEDLIIQILFETLRRQSQTKDGDDKDDEDDYEDDEDGEEKVVL